MKRQMVLTAMLAGLGSGVLGTGAQAASLADHLPAGALLTLETRNASGAVDRLGRIVERVAGSFGLAEDAQEMVAGIEEVLAGSVAREGVVGVFTVGSGQGTFTPQVLAVSRVDDLSSDMLAEMIPARPGARVGNYSFSRQGGSFVGMSGGLVYFSTNKDLLMAYLGRLSGKNAPRLMNSAAYSTPTRSMGAQELSLFMNFSATAKVARGYLAQVGLPRLLSPIVDALDTLGTYAGGLTTNDSGWTAASAHAANAQGKDQPLYRMLTHSTEFAVQDLIPADAESVIASACAPESGAYLGRWLTRLDLFDPLGFLTDTQLASHLERSGRYLGSECAQVNLAGSMKAGLNQDELLSALKYTVSYQRVQDQEAARAHLPEYAASVNAALAGLAGSLGELLSKGELGDMSDLLPEELADAGVAGAEMLSAFSGLDEELKKVKMVYALRGEYLITAFSDEALQAALNEDAEVLSQNEDFRAANLGMQGAGWSYQINFPDLTGEDLQALLDSASESAAEEEMDMADADEMADDSLGLTEEELADLTDEERELLEELLSMGQAGQADSSEMEAQVMEVVTDLINRYDGMVSQSSVQGHLILNKATVKYRW